LKRGACVLEKILFRETNQAKVGTNIAKIAPQKIAIIRYKGAPDASGAPAIYRSFDLVETLRYAQGDNTQSFNELVQRKAVG